MNNKLLLPNSYPNPEIKINHINDLKLFTTCLDQKVYFILYNYKLILELNITEMTYWLRRDDDMLFIITFFSNKSINSNELGYEIISHEQTSAIEPNINNSTLYHIEYNINYPVGHDLTNDDLHTSLDDAIAELRSAKISKKKIRSPHKKLLNSYKKAIAEILDSQEIYSKENVEKAFIEWYGGKLPKFWRY